MPVIERDALAAAVSAFDADQSPRRSDRIASAIRAYLVYAPDDGRLLVDALRQACRDTGSPTVPTPVAEAIRALGVWADAR